MPVLVQRKWMGRTHFEIEHRERPSATVRDEIAAGTTRQFPITEAQADIGIEMLPYLLRLRGLDI